MGTKTFCFFKIEIFTLKIITSQCAIVDEVLSKLFVTIHHVRRKAIFGAGWLILMQKNAHIPVYAALFLHRDQPTCTQI